MTEKEANEFILQKLLNIFCLSNNKEVTQDQIEKAKNSYKKDIEPSVKQLLGEPKMMLFIGQLKDGFCLNPKDRKKKSVLILKTNKEEELNPDMNQNFLFIELSKQILEEMFYICKDVFFPMLNQNVSQENSSELISKELMEKFHDFLAHYYVVLGQIKGKYLLPIPSEEIDKNKSINENEKTQIFEGAVVMWIDLIKFILKQEPEHQFRENKNPLPKSEIEFWEDRSNSLISILEQIKDEKITKVLNFLEKQKSAYHKMFNEIKREVEEKEKEATYNKIYLSSLKTTFDVLGDESKELPDVAEEFVPTFHIIKKIWQDNPYYQKPERLIVLIRKICNAIIERGIFYVQHSIINKFITDNENETEKEIQKVEETKRIINEFMDAYFQYKDSDEKGWKITRNVIFYRLDAFNDRLGDVLNIGKAFYEFLKVSQKIIGGIKGMQLGNSLLLICEECKKAVLDVGKKESEEEGEEFEFKTLDISNELFNVRYAKFKEIIKELERKISAILAQSFDENVTILGKFKVLDNFDTILERPYIVIELEKKYNILLDLYKGELRTVQNLFLNGKKQIENKEPKTPLNKNMPPIAALLNWTDSLKNRIQEPLEKFKTCGPRVTDKEEFKEIESSYQSIYNMINGYGSKSKDEWDEKAKVDSIEKQKNFILNKQDGLLTVNFDPGLLQLLKEVKYLKILNLPIPQEAEETFAKNSTFREQISNLENIKSQYNTIVTLLNSVEKPMLEKKLERVENLLEPGLTKWTWENTNEINKFVKDVQNTIQDLSSTVDRLKAFVAKVQSTFDEFGQKNNMLFERPELSEAKDIGVKFEAFFSSKIDVMKTKVKDYANLGDVQLALKTAVPNLSSFKETAEWKNYQHYINSIILEGLIDLIHKNLTNLYSCLDPSLNPFCKVKLTLSEQNEVIFEPSFNAINDENSIKSMLVRWINSFLNMCTMFRMRVDTSMGDYMIEILESFKINEIVYKLYNEVGELTKESDKKMDNFNDFKMYWEKNFEESFNEFLKENTDIPVEDKNDERIERIKKIFNENNPNPITKNITEYTPSKDKFDDKINDFKEKLKKVKNMENSTKVRWIEVDFSDFKRKLVEIIEQWIENYKAFLKKNSSQKITNIKEFMAKIRQGISQIPENTETEENKKLFYSILENIRDMDLLYPKIIELIPSIKGELEVLKKHTKRENEDDPYNIEDKNDNSEEVQLLLETDEIERDAPELKKKVEGVNEIMSDKIDTEKIKFRESQVKFDENVFKFKEEFLEKAPKFIKDFNREEIDNAYKIIDEYYQRTIKLEEQLKENNNMELLLKIPLSKNKMIKDCLNELGYYKEIWDLIAFYYEIFENWKQIQMDKVNKDSLAIFDSITELKQAIKFVRKEIKNTIPAYKTISDKTNQIEDTINCIVNLKEDCIKPRHWKHLNSVIGQTIPYDSPSFSFNTLLDLKIYDFKEAVETEKGIAGEQEKINIQYKRIEKKWDGEKFHMTTELNKKTYDLPLFEHTQMDFVVENLEKDQNDLTKMSQKKGILENFENMADLIKNKMETLATVDEVLKKWLKLQKNWEKLEVIFLKSEDIQNKLRNEYTQFKELDAKFREQMNDAYSYDIIIQVCTSERLGCINEMSESMAVCQIALDNYLETKKKVFPRFYFVSNDTLLNMLASADYPNLINKNIKDCFDGIKNWEMKPLDAKNKSDTVYAMNSAYNDEVVKFDTEFVCKGSLVELYLKEFEAKMRSCLSDILYVAYTKVTWDTAAGGFDNGKADAKNPTNPNQRHFWLNPFPAQLALLVTQVVWTEEVEHALEATDGGDSGALAEYYKLCVKRIEHLIDRVSLEKLTRDLRTKIITVITVDVHARDVVETFSKMKPAIDSGNFNWKKQLRFKYVPEKKVSEIQICDFNTKYSFEYIGNTGRLVITPLTDRCYITLTQALNLMLGGAPAGPAGTGKTETVKDLGRNFGLGVIVNNCSEQMDIETTARIFSGLSQTGFWGCFDEFNRISIEVLSVVSTQVKQVLDAMRGTENTFIFQGTEINLVRTTGFFITMNPGYAGRTELPDNLKALFRSCAMVVPDLKEICQNMLMSEGFKAAKPIANKFITLYTLSRDLLSKQKHYDWGLRAIKSLLRQAGGLKRNPLNLKYNNYNGEFFIIMKALFDFNKAKIVPDDMIIFERLLQDLFRECKDGNLKGDDKLNEDINNKIGEATEKEGLQKDSSFTLKTRQLNETLEVRHCLFILGPPGSGKTAVWKTLFRTNADFLNEESAYDKLSPKAVSGNELYGYVDDKTKAWKYGILSSIMKNMCKNEPPYTESLKHKWIILDGDIDPNWIESLNTVMDDNKVLTLTNGDRFPLDDYMRLIFEISNLRNATLATVSRGGVLYINEKDIGVYPFFENWLKKRYGQVDENGKEIHAVTKRILQEFFKPTFENVTGWKDKYVAPIVDMSLVQNFCCIFQHLIAQLKNKYTDLPDDTKALVCEALYFYAFMWGVGGGLSDRKDMHSLVISSMKSKNKLRFPDKGNCFDYYFDVDKLCWVNWAEKLHDPTIEENDLFSDIIIPNVEVIRLCNIIQINIYEGKPCLFIGSPGTGKTALVKYFMKNYLNELKKINPDHDEYKAFTVNFNSYTNSFLLQNIIRSQIVSRGGGRFGPLGSTKLIYFLDDLNMPKLDQFGTQSHVELLRQIIEYKEYFSRSELEVKEKLEDIFFIGCQNPTAGSFLIDQRLQRRFTLLGAIPPEKGIVLEIYTYILKSHFKEFRFRSAADKIDLVCEKIINATYTLLNKVLGEQKFNCSATKFHYQWNMRETAKIIDGVLRSHPSQYKEAKQVYCLWYHEANRVFKDRLIYEEDVQTFETLVQNTFTDEIKCEIADPKEEFKEPYIFVPFGPEITDDAPNVLVNKPYETLKNDILEYLQRYNDEKGDLPLVLFDDAIQDICRISRIISNPCSHALLVGVGGSGKQSLTRLAAFIKEIEFAMPNLTGTDYNNEAFLLDIKRFIEKSVLKPAAVPYCFLINDNHIIDEYFLVYINNFLSSYWIEELYEKKDDLNNAMEKALKSTIANYGFAKSGNDASTEQMFNYLLFRVKNNVHFVLCMSPVGDTLRVRAREFPSILSNTAIDWFHEWPINALIAVSKRSIIEMDQFREDEPTADKLAVIASTLHKSIEEDNEAFRKQERRYNYTTPKSFLELIKFFQRLIKRKDGEIEVEISRLEQGLDVIAKTSDKIADLKELIKNKSVIVEQKQKETAVTLANLEVENKKISGEKKLVEDATAEAQKVSAEAEAIEKQATEEFQKALPKKEAAKAAAENIDPSELDKFKNPNNPSPTNFSVFVLIYLIFFPEAKMPSNDIKKELPNIKNKVLGKSSALIQKDMVKRLNDVSWITDAFLEKVKKYTEEPYTNNEKMKAVSSACAGIVTYFHNLREYKRLFDIVDPLQKKAEAAKILAEESNKKKCEMEEKLEKVSGTLRKLQADLDVQIAAKEAVEKEMADLMSKLATAEKFIGLLEGNNKRWKEDCIRLKEERKNIAGDCLLSSSFVSYIGVFNKRFRDNLVVKWTNIITEKQLPITPNIDIVRTLTTEAELLQFKKEELPADPFSEQNAVIITQCTRYPLIIDPQMQAIGWLKNREGEKTVVQYREDKWDEKIGEEIGKGNIIIIEDVPQEIDPLLSPIMGKQTTNKDKGGKTQVIRVGSADYNFNPKTAIYFITKMSNPHYKPEIVAQCTLINFIVTERGLEDQLLALVVNIEQPDLEENIRKCVNEVNALKASLINNEKDVLAKLNSANPDTILDNKELIDSLETTKKAAEDIQKSTDETNKLIADINNKREVYRGVGQEGAMLFFLISKLFVIENMYQYSLSAFQYFFEKAIGETEKDDNLLGRVEKLRKKIRITIYIWISAGMFERDKKLLMTMISLKLLEKGVLTDPSVKGVTRKHIDFLLLCPTKPGTEQEKAMQFLDTTQWESLCYLSDLDGLQGFAEKVQKEYSTKFKEWFNEITPEDVPLPPEWKEFKKYSFHKILILRAVRPERVGIALNEFIKVCLPEGDQFLSPRTFTQSLEKSFDDSSPSTPIFFILSPGSNPIKDLEILGKTYTKQKYKKTFTLDHNFKYVAMGQNAEIIAQEYLKTCNANGEWLFLQNIHLMPKWLKTLEDKMKELSKEKGSDDFRLYLSAEPSNGIPVGILEKCIKLTNEPPSGLKQNMQIAFNTLKEEALKTDDKKRRGIVFGLCYYHAVVIERKKFGSLGWNRNYPFNLDDLRNSDLVAAKYVETSGSKIPWEDLKYIVGEIMYGGHIVDDLDRKLNNAYLNYILDDKLLEDLDLVPYPSNSAAMRVDPIKTPINNDQYSFEIWDKYIDLFVTSESPALYGLHPNAELEYRITETKTLFNNLTDLEGGSGGSSGESGEGGDKNAIIKEELDQFVSSTVGEGVFDLIKMRQASDHELEPDQNVFMQECEQMRNLCQLIIKNCKDAVLAIDGKLTMDERIEKLLLVWSQKRVPAKWLADGFASKRPLGTWQKSLEKRIAQLKIFEGSDNTVPKVVFINRLFNPLSYLTSVRQIAARVLNDELDKLDIQTEPSPYYLNVNPNPNVVFKGYEASKFVPIYGLHLQGCRFDKDNNTLDESRPKESYFVLPIIYCKVVKIEMLDPKKELKNHYICPMYKTIDRQSTFVCFAQFKSKVPPAKWTIAGVAVILECEKTDAIENWAK